jgi:hypothetical protein
VVHSVEGSRHWIVRCLGCKNPVVLCAESVETATGLVETKVNRWKERGFLRAWCNGCSREYPYRSSDIECLSGPSSERKERSFFPAGRDNPWTRSIKV